MRRLAKCWVVAVIAWAGVHTSPCAASERYISSVDDAKAIYGAFLTQWMGKGDAPTNVADKAAEPTAEDVEQYTECAGERNKSTNWTTGGSSADFESALASLARVEPIDATQWRATDPGELIANGQSVGAAVDAGYAGGLMTLSAISFNETRDIAMLAYSFQCGRLCGQGGIVMFNRTSRGWVQSKRQCGSWVS